MGGGNAGAGGGLGGRGAAASAHGATLASHGTALANHGAHASAIRAANATGKHAAVEHETSKLAGTDHHHHIFRREPQYSETGPQFFFLCSGERLQVWSDFCSGPSKSLPGKKGRS
jgi:hypothetical protein